MTTKMDYAKPTHTTKNVKRMATKKKQPRFYKVSDTIALSAATAATGALTAYTYVSLVCR